MNAIILVISLLVAHVVGLPHVGMLATPEVRDVGLIFTGANYTGDSTFVIETTKTPTCLPINVDRFSKAQGLHIKSVQICKPTTCAFFTGEKCTQSSTGVFSVSCKGPGDVPNHDSNDIFKSYICGNNIAKRADLEDVHELVTEPHDPSTGMF